MVAASIEQDSKESFQRENSLWRQISQILTLRGATLLIFAIFLITGPVPEHSDLIAAVVGYSFLILVALLTITTLILGSLFQSYAQFRLTYRSPSSPPASGEPLELHLLISQANLLPFFSLRVTPWFEHPFDTSSWKVIGALQQNKDCTQELRPPHRGYWKISQLSLSFQDTFGITKFGWRESFSFLPTIPVHPQKMTPRSLPIYTAELSSGAEQTELERTEGDPYDIKRYHPSDGMRKILWKVYAKSGELLSRHPEPSMTPEGVVALLLLAGQFDDELCALHLSYLKSLEEKDYEFLLAVEGDGSQNFASSSDDAEERILSSVWSCEATANTDRIRTIDGLRDAFSSHRTTTLRRVTFFLSAERLLDEHFFSEMELLQVELINRQLEALWIVHDRGEAEEKTPISEQNQLQRLLYAPKEKVNIKIPRTTVEKKITAFTQTCEASGFLHIITR